MDVVGMRTTVAAASRAASAAPLAASFARSPRPPTVSRALFHPDVIRPIESSTHWPSALNRSGVPDRRCGWVSAGGGCGSVTAAASAGGLGAVCAKSAPAKNKAPVTKWANTPARRIRRDWMTIIGMSRCVARIGFIAEWVGTILPTSMAKMRRSSNDVGCRYDADDERGHADGEPERQPFFDDGASARTIAVEEESDQVETHPARDDGQKNERDDRVFRKTRRNGYDLVWNRRHAFEQDDPGSPLDIGFAEGLDLAAIAIELHQPQSERLVEIIANCPAEHATGDRCERAHRSVEVRLIRPRQRHRDEHRIGRYR